MTLEIVGDCPICQHPWAAHSRDRGGVPDCSRTIGDYPSCPMCREALERLDANSAQGGST